MKLSTRCRYGARAMLEIAKRSGNGPVKRKDIAQSQDVTEAYLENILSVLKRQGFVRTIRGADGGFVLQRPPSKISMLDIVLALEGSIAPVDCIDNAEECEKSPNCATRNVWRRLYDAQRELLSGISLLDVADMDAKSGAFNYEI